MTILRAHMWRNNAELIDAVRELGYIRDDDYVLDPTYGRGTWWKNGEPAHFVKHDIATVDGVDFRSTPEADGTFDVVTFDPPYIAQGGRASSTLKKRNGTTDGDFLNRYGIDEVPRTPDELHEYIAAGLKEALRVLKPGGVLLVKCMNYVSRNAYQDQAYRVWRAAIEMGFTMLDEFVHLHHPGPQPKRNGQKHTRANYSILFVFKAPK